MAGGLHFLGGPGLVLASGAVSWMLFAASLGVAGPVS